MALQINTIVQTCQAIARQVKEARKTLTIHFIVHHEGQRVEALALAGQEITWHPAAETALHLLKSAKHSEESALIGVAVARESLFFGMAAREPLLALCSINMDQYETLEDVRRHAYHLAWHALDACDYQERARRTGAPNQVIVRRRSLLESASANMQADSFAAVMCTLQGHNDVIRNLGTSRGQNVLQMISAHNPEHFPFVIAMESVILAMEQMKNKPVTKHKYIETALRIAREVGMTFGKDSLKQWFTFGEPAQDMAWRGYNDSEILSAAINTSDDTYVRATGYLISEVTGIKPASVMKIRESYSAFADDEFNNKLHEKSINEVFEYVIAQGLKQKNSEPFLAMANRQNVRMTEGQMVGWCAAALQVSAQAFDDAIRAGNEKPEEIARREFRGEEKKTKWDALKAVGKKIIDQYRQGQLVTLNDVSEICKGEQGAGAIRKAVTLTMQDPGFQKSLENGYDLGARPSPAPRTPAPSVARAATPAVAAVSAPGMGLGGRPIQVRQTVRQQTDTAVREEQRE